MESILKRCLDEIEVNSSKRYKLILEDLAFPREQIVVGTLNERKGFHLRLKLVDQLKSPISGNVGNVPRGGKIFEQTYANAADIKEAFVEFAFENALQETKKGNIDFGLKSYRKLPDNRVKIECIRCGYRFTHPWRWITILCQNRKCNNQIEPNPPGKIYGNNFRLIIPSTIFSYLEVDGLSLVQIEYRAPQTLMGTIELTHDPVTYRQGMVRDYLRSLDA